MRKKHRLAKILHDTRLFEMLAPLSNDSLVAFNYHRIQPDDPAFTTPFEAGVYGPTASQFYAQMAWLKRYRRILSEAELLDCLENNPAELRRCALITFDDGYRDNFTLAYPILKALEIPALYFIPTNLINTRQVGWWDIIAYLIQQCQRTTIEFAGRELSLSEHRDQAINFLTQKMKLEKSEKTADLLTKLAAACDVPMPPPVLQDEQLMTWDQIREVSQDFVAIGSHTHTHRVLATLDAATQSEELVVSKAILEAEIGKPVQSISYPVGGSRHFTEQTQTLAKSAGYELGFSYRTGPNAKGKPMRFNIKRTTGPSQTSLMPAITILHQLFVDREDESRYQLEAN